VNLARHLARAARAFPDRPALARGATVVATWRQMAMQAARLAGGLRVTLGLAPGERVALVMRNSPAYAELLYACWHAGLAAVPVNAKLHPKELAYIIDHSQARVVLASDDHAQDVASAVADAGAAARVIVIDGADYARLAQADPVAIAQTEANDVAWLFYTSGTTGRPKGAMLTHRNLLAMATSYFVDIDPPAPGALIHGAPMSHGSGIYMVPHVAQANCQVIPESGGFDAGEILDLLGTWHASMFAAPTMVNRLVQHPAADTARIDNLRVIVWGGAPMYVADLEAAIARFGYRFAQLYGQGESPMTITGMTRALVEDAHRRGDHARLASAGIPQTVVEVRIADADDRELAAGGIGEIQVRGDSVMRGYWRNEDATAETLRGGWLHTGDLGSFDDAGYLTLRDRSKDVIISGGSNIYPREVEEVLLRDAAVAEVSVIGVPDPQWGEAVVAFVVPRAGRTLDEAALDRLCLDNIARFKRPKAYRVVAQLPKSAYGKILKTELRALYRGEQ
jgi:long-chain acyl-CoA synthetase